MLNLGLSLSKRNLLFAKKEENLNKSIKGPRSQKVITSTSKNILNNLS